MGNPNQNEADARAKALIQEDSTPDDHWFYDYIHKSTEVREKPTR